MRAWDLRTGKLVWTFHTIPRPGEPNHDAWKNDQWVDRAGANAWGFITVDEARGIAYVPTGTPATDFYGGDRLGSNLYGSSLLALDAATGKLKWFFQTTHHDNWDYDLNSPPALIDIKRNGRTIPAVAVYTKQGLLFVFDRVTGTPVFGVEERPVVSDNPLPGDEVLAHAAVSAEAAADCAHDVLSGRGREGDAGARGVLQEACSSWKAAR